MSTNQIFELTVAALAQVLGSTPTKLDSGNGCRFTKAARGKATVYHADIAPGNRAEIAFEPASFAARLKMEPAQAAAYFAQIHKVTGRPVSLNSRFKWPRVGIVDALDLERLMSELARHYSN